MPDDDDLNLDEAAELAGVHPSTIWRWEKRGWLRLRRTELPSGRNRRSVFVRRGDLDALLDRLRNPVAS